MTLVGLLVCFSSFILQTPPLVLFFENVDVDFVCFLRNMLSWAQWSEDEMSKGSTWDSGVLVDTATVVVSSVV